MASHVWSSLLCELSRTLAIISSQMAGSPGGEPGSLCSFIDLKIYLHQLLFGCLRPHQLNGRYACLWVQLGHVQLAASADGSLCLLLPFIGCMLEHLIQNYKTMRAILRPVALETQEQLHIYGPLQLLDPVCAPRWITSLPSGIFLFY